MDPIGNIMLRAACFVVRVIECVSAYFKGYSSITKGEAGEVMRARVRAEIADGLLCVVDEPCVCVHPCVRSLRVMMISG